MSLTRDIAATERAVEIIRKLAWSQFIRGALAGALTVTNALMIYVAVYG